VAEAVYQRLDRRTGQPVPGKFEFTYMDSAGRQRWQTVKGDTKADAKAERAEMVARLHRGERVERSSRTVGDVAAVWLERARGKNGPWDAPTKQQYDRIVRQQVLASVDEARRPLGINPVLQLEPGEKPRWRVKHVRVLEGADLARLLDHAAAWRVLFEFLAYTGLRIGEALGVRWYPVFVSRQLGHSDPAITFRVYAHLFEQADSAAAAREALEALGDGGRHGAVTDARSLALLRGHAEPPQVLPRGLVRRVRRQRLPE
jgi:integrase